MYGYVRPVLETLSEDDASRFRRIYCGLCHTLGERYGQPSRFILNYDFTFLSVLLSDGQEGACGNSRCYSSPVHKREYLRTNAALALAADESVILAYWQLRDGVTDHDWLHGIKYRALSAILEPAYRKARSYRPEFDIRTRTQLEVLRRLEESQCDSLDIAADSFAVLLQGAALEVKDLVKRRILEQLLYHLGRWIYLIDAADDLKKDAASGNYNAVALRYRLKDGIWTPEARRSFAATLDHSVRMMATAYELWDFGVWSQILQSTFYSSLFQVGKAVLDGTFQPKPHHRIDRKDTT